MAAKKKKTAKKATKKITVKEMKRLRGGALQATDAVAVSAGKTNEFDALVYMRRSKQYEGTAE